jgi:stringent starvation protein B
LTNSAISFRARFSGVPFDVWVPMKSVLGIYARETGQGMIFSHDTDNSTEQAVQAATADEVPRQHPYLRVVK